MALASKDDVRCQIVQTARELFSHFGYAKTTMSDVAGRLSMSPGNLYRYFAGKLDIAEAIAEEAEEHRRQVLTEIVDREGVCPIDKLREYLFSELRMTYAKLDSDKRVLEMAQIISSERPEWANRMLAEERKLLGRILREGIEHGIFEPADIEVVAEMIQCATMKWRYPQLWSKLKLPQLERELDGAFRILARGLLSPKFTDGRRPGLCPEGAA